MQTYLGYIRVSTPRQGERGVSLQEQRDAIIRYASKFNLNITDWFEEQQTAAKRGRPVWNRMLKLLREGKASGVVIHKIDRSARNLKDWADLGEMIDQGIEVHFVNESLDLHSRGGRLSADIQAVVAADYVRNLREEAKKGIHGRLKQGFFPMRAPIGYADNGAGKAKTIHPEKGPLIRQAFELYASGRYPILPLCEELYRRGLRNHNDGRVSRNGLSTILNNSFYMGVIRIKRTGESYLGNHEALISKRLFEAVQDVRDGRLNTRKKIHEFLFRKLVRCKRCNYALIGELRKGHVYYRCHTQECPTKCIREERIAGFVEESLARLRFSPAEMDYLKTATERLKREWIEAKDRQLAALTMKLKQVGDRLTRLTDAFLDQTIDKSLFEDRKQGLLFERRSIEEHLGAMKNNPDGVPARLQKFLELAGRMYSLYQEAIPEKKRTLVKIATSNLTLDQSALDFPYASPFRHIAERNAASDGGPSKGLARTCDTLLDSLLTNSNVCESITAGLDDTGPNG